MNMVMVRVKDYSYPMGNESEISLINVEHIVRIRFNKDGSSSVKMLEDDGRRLDIDAEGTEKICSACGIDYSVVKYAAERY